MVAHKLPNSMAIWFVHTKVNLAHGFLLPCFPLFKCSFPCFVLFLFRRTTHLTTSTMVAVLTRMAILVEGKQ